jgi:hypothetical protein
MKYDVFISHAREDKAEFVSPLAERLVKLGVRVWYDELSLQIGDSLAYSIDEGLANSSFGIVVLSRSFLQKSWTKYELQSLIQKEMNAPKTILPIWHDINYNEVLEFSPFLAGKFSIDTSNTNIEDIVNRVVRGVRPDIYEKAQADSKANEVAPSLKEPIKKRKVVSLSFDTENVFNISVDMPAFQGRIQHFVDLLREFPDNFFLSYVSFSDIQQWFFANVHILHSNDNYMAFSILIEEGDSSLPSAFTLGIFDKEHSEIIKSASYKIGALDEKIREIHSKHRLVVYE